MYFEHLVDVFFLLYQHIDAVERLIHSYPKFITVASLPCDTTAAKVLHR